MFKRISFLLIFSSALIFSGCGDFNATLSFVDFSDIFAVDTQILKKDGTELANLENELATNYNIKLDSIEYTVPNLNIKFTSSLIESNSKKIKTTVDTSETRSFSPTEFGSQVAFPFLMTVLFDKSSEICNKATSYTLCSIFEEQLDNYIDAINNAGKNAILKSLLLTIHGHDTQTNSLVTLQVTPSRAEFDCQLIDNPFSPEPEDTESTFTITIDFNSKLQCYSLAYFTLP